MKVHDTIAVNYKPTEEVSQQGFLFTFFDFSLSPLLLPLPLNIEPHQNVTLIKNGCRSLLRLTCRFSRFAGWLAGRELALKVIEMSRPQLK